MVALVCLSIAPAAADAAKFGQRTLQTGSTGHDVKVLQSWLDKMGFQTDIDGQFGRHTRWSLRRFEQARGLKVDGVLTPQDATAMRSAMAAHYSFVQNDSSDGNAGGVPPNGSPEQNYQETGTQTGKATMSSDGLHAIAPADAPPQVVDAIAAANKIVGKPYKYGGGHGTWNDSGYDCSGTVSYALHGAGLLEKPLASGDFESWGTSGKGQWITVYANGGHAYAIIAGLRLDTSGDASGSGPRWHTDLRSGSGYVVRHPDGL